MTTAKPQQVGGDSDSSDDLIAELAKLMAQDAHSDRAPAAAKPISVAAPVAPQPVVAAAPAPVVAPTVRIPGMNFGGQPVPRFDFGEVAPVTPIEPVAKATPPVEAPALQAKVEPRLPPTFDPIEEKVEPFRFDFGLPPLRSDAPASRIVPEAVPVAADAEPFHDSIADLIAADMPDLVAKAPEPVAPVAKTPEPVAEPEPVFEAPKPVVAPEPVATGSQRPVVRNWTPTQVAAPRPTTGPAIGRANVRAVNLTPVVKAPTPKAAPSVQSPVAEAPSQPDNFKVAPIFGFGSPNAPAPTPVSLPDELVEPVFTPAPSLEVVVDNTIEPMAFEPVRTPRDEFSGVDPIDEIESLIGQAVRVELDRRPVASPALRSLANPEPVEPVIARDPAPVDDPVLEAMRVSTPDSVWAEPATEEAPAVQRKARREKSESSSGLGRAIAGPLVAVGLLLVAGLGLYWVLGLGGRPDGAVPKLVADATPIKQAPPVVAATDDTKQSVVFSEMDGAAPAADEQLVSRDQSDVSEVTQVAPTETNDDGLANRKVRTVTVRPDGTIVSGDDAVAGTAILPVDRPNVPAVPGAETASPALLAAAASDTITPPAATPAAVTPTPLAAAAPAAPVAEVSSTPAAPGSMIAVVDTAGTPVTGKTAPIPMVRPKTFTNADLPEAAPVATAPGALPMPAPTATGALPRPAPVAAATAAGSGPIPLAQALAAQQSNTAVAAAPTAASTGTAPAYVQLSSQRSEADAQATAAAMQAKYGSLFGGSQLEIQRSDLGAKGIYYRVRLPAQSRQSAAAMCSSLKANGGDCFVL